MDTIISMIVEYAKGGIIIWVLWYIACMVYIFSVTGLDLVEIRALARYAGIDLDKKTRHSVKGILEYIVWPWGIYSATSRMVDVVEGYKKQRAQR